MKKKWSNNRNRLECCLLEITRLVISSVIIIIAFDKREKKNRITTQRRSFIGVCVFYYQKPSEWQLFNEIFDFIGRERQNHVRTLREQRIADHVSKTTNDNNFIFLCTFNFIIICCVFFFLSFFKTIRQPSVTRHNKTIRQMMFSNK